MNDAPQNIIINGNDFPFEPGETILEVAKRNSIDIPTLCHLKGTTPTGACRICVVEIEGARSLVPACSSPARVAPDLRVANPKVVVALRGRPGLRGAAV